MSESMKGSQPPRPSQPPPELIRSRSLDPLEVGRIVKVKRFGELEDGFEITKLVNNGNVAVVQKNQGANILRTRISIRELESLNPPRQ